MATKKTAAKTYKVTGPVLFDGELMMPADPETGRQADTVQLTDAQAQGLAGFVQPVDATDSKPTE